MALSSKFISILVLLVLFVPVFSFSQEFEELATERGPEPDTREKTVEPKIQGWYNQEWGAFQDSTVLDTLIDNFHLYHPVFKESLTASYLGNYGTPALNNNFFNRRTDVKFFFLTSRSAYILTPENLVFYNTRTPYTRLDFSQSENKSVKNETRFNVFHSQNVNPFWNFTARFELAKSAGQYISQQSKNNSISIYTSYNKDHVNLYSGFVSNLIKNAENGGLSSDDLLFNGAGTEFLNVNLNASKSQFNSTYFFANSEYRFGKIIETEGEPDRFRPIFGVLYNGQYQRNKQLFTDEENEDNQFFNNTYYPETYLIDSIRFNIFSNLFQIKQYENADRKYSFGKRAFLGYDFSKASSPGTLVLDSVTRREKQYSNLYLGGGIYRETGKFWNWNFKGKIYVLGRNVGQTELSGIISKPFTILKDSTASLEVSGILENRVADYFQEEFYSNHYQWNNNFNMEQRMTVNGSFNVPARKLRVSANYALINNYIYNDGNGVPAQTSNELLVLSAFVDKDFNYRNLHFRTRVLWQKVSNSSYIHVPDLSAFVSAYYKLVISKVMFTQLGVDTRYNTKYYADAYSPATGLFYLQNQKKYGNYPYIDVYANLRLKRTTVFFKMLNVGTRFLDGEYITTPNYPMPRSSFRFGVSWLFYD